MDRDVLGTTRALASRDGPASCHRRVGEYVATPMPGPSATAQAGREIHMTDASAAGQGATIHISAVTPTLNEAKNIRLVLRAMPICVDAVIIVDGQSLDTAGGPEPQENAGQAGDRLPG